MLDYTQYLTTTALPEASSMIESFRAIGYSIEAALADIVDNSISASAKNIWIDYEWKGPASNITVIDDGTGMSNDALINAMRPGSRNPLETRNVKDLGRFGLGLKTASFSQCRKFSVVSKSLGGDISFWCWDIDFVSQTKSWSLIKYCPDKKYEDAVNILNSGTAIIWWELDRITKDTSVDSAESIDKFMKTMEDVKRHLSLVFHRFISEGLNIFFRGRKIEPWDPFMIGYDGLQVKPEMKLNNGKILLKGYVLPHRSKLTTEEYNKGKGPKDSWTAHQGFYVYRNKRLLVAGEWLGIGNFKKEVHYDLCRILIDLPNDCDDDWQIDIKKSIARPPLKFKEQILSVARDVRAQAVEVYRNKGKIIRRKYSQTEEQFLWEDYKRHDKRFYKLNRNHPVLKHLLECADIYKSEIEIALRFIEETIPVPLITLKENENEIPHGQPFEGTNHDLILTTIKIMYQNLIRQGKNDEQAKAIILNIEPFHFYPHYIEYLNTRSND